MRTETRKSTYSLDIIIDTICKGDEVKINLVRGSLYAALQLFQWQYQNTSNDDSQRKFEKDSEDAINRVIHLLEQKGDNTGAELVHDSLLEDYKIQTQSLTLSEAKRFMKEQCVGDNITLSAYTKQYALLMGCAFKEWCEEYKIDEAPAYLDSGFDPYDYM